MVPMTKFGISEQVTLTVVMPIYNEIDTLNEVIANVLAVELANTTIDLVIVESNSNDGSKEEVMRLLPNPRITVIFQQEPKGKGFAVREGLNAAKGKIILIQDADDEYDVADYEKLVTPIVTGQATFVSGTRHKPGEPMRSFGRRGVRSSILNVGHKLFTYMFNVVYRVKLTDPFTMYKVFKTDIIRDISFVSNRFDFDWELVAKLIRTGHYPLEIPVSYNSRGFEEGKKVRPFRDPITWIVALIKFRVTKI
jgi:glycosyltransferase involved in cell wall biosynthesis